jgi:hypothetical protein
MNAPLLFFYNFFFGKAPHPLLGGVASWLLLSGSMIIFVIYFLIIPGSREWKWFRFYYARTCINAIKLEPGADIFRNIKYLVMGLNQYNKYLMSNSKVKIKIVNQLVSKIMSDSEVIGQNSLKEISDAFKGDNKLKPITTLKALLTNTGPEEFLVRDPFAATIQTWGPLIAAVISAVAAVIGLFFTNR